MPALTLESPGERFLSTEEQELVQDLDDAMWDPKLQVLPSSSSCLSESPPQIPEEFRNLEPIWRKLNKASLDQVGRNRDKHNWSQASRAWSKLAIMEQLSYDNEVASRSR